MEDEEQLSLVFAALADRTRREIMCAPLLRGSATVGEISAPLSISAPAVSQHLRKSLSGQVSSYRTVNAQWRTLSLQSQPLDAATAWIQEQRGTWNLRLDALEAHLGRRNDSPTSPP